MAPWILVMMIMATGGCSSGGSNQPVMTLDPPATALPQAAAQVAEGNRLFRNQEWEMAKSKYEAATKSQPSLAEAHYNLALTLERMGDPAGAKPHYLEAASLAPGHKTIWNAPPLRKHTVVDPVMEKGKEFMDAHPH